MAAKKKTTGNTTSFSNRIELFLEAIKEWERDINQNPEKYEVLLPNDVAEAIKQIGSEKYQKLQALIVEKIKQLPEKRLKALSIPKGGYGTSNVICVENITPVYVVYDEPSDTLTTMPGDWLPENELSELNNELSKFNNSTENENAILEAVSPVVKKYHVPIIHGFIILSLNDLEVLADQLAVLEKNLMN